MDSLVPFLFLGQGETLTVDALLQLPVPLQRRTIVKWLRASRIRDLSYNVVERVRSLIAPGLAIAKVNLPGDRHARRRRGEIFIE